MTSRALPAAAAATKVGGAVEEAASTAAAGLGGGVLGGASSTAYLAAAAGVAVDAPQPICARAAGFYAKRTEVEKKNQAFVPAGRSAKGVTTPLVPLASAS